MLCFVEAAEHSKPRHKLTLATMGKIHADMPPFFKWWEYNAVAIVDSFTAGGMTARERIPTRRHHDRRANPHEAASRQEKLCKS